MFFFYFKKISPVFILIFIFNAHLFSQVLDPDLEYNLKQTRFSGAKINDTFIFDDVTPFYNNKAWVKINNKWGLISNSGSKLYPFNLDEIKINPIYNQVVAIKRDSLWTILNYSTGQIVTNFIYKNIEIVNNNIVAVKQDSFYGILSTSTGYMLTPFLYDSIGAMNDKKVWVMKNKKWGLIDTLGKTYTKFEFYKIEGCENNPVCFVNNGTKWYVFFMQENTKILKEFSFDEILYDFKNEIALVKSNSIYRYINSRGLAFQLRKEYAELGIVSNDKAWVRDKKQNWVLYDMRKNQEIKNQLIIDDGLPYKDNLAWAKQNNKWALVNSEGLIQTAFVFLKVMTSNISNLAWVYPYKTNAWMLINQNGQCPDIEKKAFKEVKSFKNEMAVVYHQFGWGAISPSGKILIPFYYDDLTNFDNGRGFAKYNNKWAIITTKGKHIKPAMKFNSQVQELNDN